MSTRQRPLSPHLGIYRFMYTMATSIAHRITGIVLSVGLVVLVGWLFAAASGAERYEQASAPVGCSRSSTTSATASVT